MILPGLVINTLIVLVPVLGVLAVTTVPPVTLMLPSAVIFAAVTVPPETVRVLLVVLEIGVLALVEYTKISPPVETVPPIAPLVLILIAPLVLVILPATAPLP